MGRANRLRGLALAAVLVSGCGDFAGAGPGDGASTRVTKWRGATVISETDPHYRRFELPEAEGECVQDDDCNPSGCSGEVCTTTAAAWDTLTTCDATHPGKQFYCGCLASRCRWHEP